MYFIVSGKVLIQVTETDKRTGCSKKQVTVVLKVFEKIVYDNCTNT